MKINIGHLVLVVLLSSCAHSLQNNNGQVEGDNNYLGCPHIDPMTSSELGRTSELCRKNPNCEVVSFGCYCPPDVKCICGGHPPPVCKQIMDGSYNKANQL